MVLRKNKEGSLGGLLLIPDESFSKSKTEVQVGDLFIVAVDHRRIDNAAIQEAHRKLGPPGRDCVVVLELVPPFVVDVDGVEDIDVLVMKGESRPPPSLSQVSLHRFQFGAADSPGIADTGDDVFFGLALRLEVEISGNGLEFLHGLLLQTIHVRLSRTSPAAGIAD